MQVVPSLQDNKTVLKVLPCTPVDKNDTKGLHAAAHGRLVPE